MLARALSQAVTALAPASDSPRADALLLLAHVIDQSREWILAHDEESLSQPQAEQFTKLCAQRAAGTPITYILGSAEFYGRKFVVNQSVLVPRPETEHLIDEVLIFFKTRAASRRPNPITILDAGTGSGAIACTVAAELPSTRIDATDISSEALAVAKENAGRLNVADRCTFHHGTLPSPIPQAGYDAVIANLPYIPTADVPRLPDPTSFEPHQALDGGPDGLDAYRKLLTSAPKLLKPGGLLLLEGAPPVIESLALLAADAFPKTAVEIKPDYAGLARYVKLRVRP